MPEQDADLRALDGTLLHAEVLRLRNAIRLHRDQRGDDRCWLDDVLLYKALPETVHSLTQLQPKDEFMLACEKFWCTRQCPAEPAYAGQQTEHRTYTDDDLAGKDLDGLLAEAGRLRTGIRSHRDKGDARSWRDDATLYQLLPEKDPGITALPPKHVLLGNCKNYWQTRQTQHPPKLHEW
jgi:hypothetical protein